MLAQALQRVPSLVLTDEAIAAVKTKEDLKNLAAKISASLKGSMKFYLVSGKASLARSVRMNVKSLLKFGEDVLLEGYDERAMRERAFDGVQKALAGVVQRGTAAASQIRGVMLAGKTGTAQSGRFRGGQELNHAWFVGFAPANDAKIVVAVMLEFGGHGTRAAHIASKIIEHYLKVQTTQVLNTEGD